MKKIKSIFILIFAVILVTESSITAFAAPTDTAVNTLPTDNISRTSNTYASFEDCIANSIMLSETIEDFEKEYNTQFKLKPENISKEMINVDAAWVADANNFLDNYVAAFRTRSKRAVVSSPSPKQTAKATAMMYSFDRAAFSLQRTPGLDFNKEVQYMFLSHYIDRNEYYWSTENERYLLDGPSMSGESGALADWITSSDRQAYNSYLSYSGLNTSMQQLGNLAVNIRSYKGMPEDIAGGIQALKKSNVVMTTAYGLVLLDPTLSIPETISNEVVPLANQVLAELSQNPNIKLSAMYDRFMGDEGMLSMYNKPDKSSIIMTSLSIAGAFIIAGPAGGLTAAVGEIISGSLSFTINTYTNFFNYAAWVSLRYGYSGRYANRTWYYITGQDT